MQFDIGGKGEFDNGIRYAADVCHFESKDA